MAQRQRDVWVRPAFSVKKVKCWKWGLKILWCSQYSWRKSHFKVFRFASFGIFQYDCIVRWHLVSLFSLTFASLPAPGCRGKLSKMEWNAYEPNDVCDRESETRVKEIVITWFLFRYLYLGNWFHGNFNLHQVKQLGDYWKLRTGQINNVKWESDTTLCRHYTAIHQLFVMFHQFACRKFTDRKSNNF